MKEREQLFIPQIESSVKVSGDVDRRRFLQAASVGAASLVVPARIAGMTVRSKATSCIQLVLIGGPSHLDTFDLKPDAPSGIRGPFRPIKTNVPGMEISELFPRIAKQADKFALLRSLHHSGAADHGSGLEILESGGISTDIVVLPWLGAVISAKFGSKNDGAPLACLPGTSRRLGEGTRSRATNELSNAFLLPPERDVRIREGLPAFDSQRYGDSLFGRNCHRAIELVAGGMPFVTIDMFDSLVSSATWDIHGSSPFAPISSYRDFVGPMFDQAYSALLEDLSRSGLLETTLVVATGEFGRTPQINPCGGRDHWPHCWSALVAGGGVRGGHVVGESDEIGAYPRERPATPADVVATIYHALGIDYRSKTKLEGIGYVPIVPEGAKPIHELF